jgi:hypothetical protein
MLSTVPAFIDLAFRPLVPARVVDVGGSRETPLAHSAPGSKEPDSASSDRADLRVITRCTPSPRPAEYPCCQSLQWLRTRMGSTRVAQWLPQSPPRHLAHPAHQTYGR